MLDLLYTLFIQPLEFWMSKALMWGYDQTHSWGLAIIVMSLVVNIVILPIYLKAESWQEEERSIRKRIENDENMIKETFKGQERFAMISTLYRQAGFSPLMTLRSSVGFFLQIPFFFAAYHFLSHFDPFQGVSFWGLNNLAKPDEMLSITGISINVMPILMTVINLASALIYTQNLSRKDKIQLYGMAGIFLVLLYDAASGLVLYWTCNNIFSFFKNLIITSPLSNKAAKNKIYSQLNNGDNLDSYASILFFPSTVLISVLILIYFPMSLYGSDPFVFKDPASQIFSNLISNCLFAILLACIVASLHHTIKIAVTFLNICLIFSTICFAFVFEPDYGVIDAFQLQKLSNLTNKNLKTCLIDGIVIILAFIFSFFAFKYRYYKYLKAVFLVSTCTLLAISTLEFSKISSTEKSNIAKKEYIIPSNVHKMMTFTQKGQNVVVLMLDGFTGSHIGDLIKMEPELINELDGFIWYKDSFSSGTSTILGKPGILGGEKVAAFNLIDKNQSSTLEEIINKSWSQLFSYLQENNYEIFVFDDSWLDQKLVNKFLVKPISSLRGYTLWDELPAYWTHNRSITSSKEESSYDNFFILYGLFKATPIGQRHWIYNGGKWHSTINLDTHAKEWTLHWWSQLDSFTEMSFVTNSPKNQFKFLINESTHHPWALNKNCQPFGIANPNSRLDNGIHPAHLQAEMCSIKSLSKWFNWMKSRQIYNNTMIIITSDHGWGDSKELFTTLNTYKGKPNSLLMVKKFDSNHPLQIDDRALTANWDIPELIKSKGQSLSIWYDTNRRRCHLIADWQRTRHPNNSFNKEDLLCVNGSIFNKKNWEYSLDEANSQK